MKADDDLVWGQCVPPSLGFALCQSHCIRCAEGVQIENVTTTYIMKVDDDNFVRLDAVMDEIEHTGFTSGLYMGNVNEFHKPLRDGKWAVTEEVRAPSRSLPYALSSVHA